MTKKVLGRGLSALLENADTDITGLEPKALHSIAEIKISQIIANPFQPRTEFDEEALNELSESIKVHGIIQPITVRKIGYEKYELISGERRTRASILAGLNAIPAYIRLANDQQMLEMALIENIQRENLNSIEVALSYKRLLDECGLKQEELGDRVGKKRSTVNNYLRLLKLPDEIQMAIKEGELMMGHARALVNVENPENQLAIFRAVINGSLSVRQVEDLVRTEKETPADTGTHSRAAAKYFDFTNFLKDKASIEKKFNTDIRFKSRSNDNGTIIISFSSKEQLEEILSKMV
ncbi:MAG TPA: chromosome partitioning protein ParB [Bacteroidetes bacterium]|jgi:ParB family transcriptional regulator, chromosome partitioning protein|nr:chromosome partitioning protein ParB [Bacteroidota bacterium]|tara:strand:+ start:741 stop:1622 length:882 start_codon:yes stop_codon:yes gene_type:complete